MGQNHRLNLPNQVASRCISFPENQSGKETKPPTGLFITQDSRLVNGATPPLFFQTLTQVKTKQVYEKEEETEGFRGSIDKLWPRGIKKEDLRDALWAKDLAPSTSLRKGYHEDEEARWNEFRERYTPEFRENPAWPVSSTESRKKRQ